MDIIESIKEAFDEINNEIAEHQLAVAELESDREKLKTALELLGVRERKNHVLVKQESIRDAVRYLGDFSIKELAESLDVSYDTARRKLEPYLVSGAVERVGRRYHYKKPTDSGAAFNLQKTLSEVESITSGSAPVAGTGRGSALDRIADADIRKLVKKATDSDPRLMIVGGGSHMKLKRGKSTIVTVPTTPSDHRTKANLRAELRRKGVNV